MQLICDTVGCRQFLLLAGEDPIPTLTPKSRRGYFTQCGMLCIDSSTDTNALHRYFDRSINVIPSDLRQEDSLNITAPTNKRRHNTPHKPIMARFIPGVTVSPHATRHVDPLTDLTRLLSRLQQTILRADAEREARLRSNEFEREKAQTVRILSHEPETGYTMLTRIYNRTSTTRDPSSPSSNKRPCPSRSTSEDKTSKPTSTARGSF